MKTKANGILNEESVKELDRAGLAVVEKEWANLARSLKNATKDGDVVFVLGKPVYVRQATAADIRDVARQPVAIDESAYVNDCDFGWCENQ